LESDRGRGRAPRVLRGTGDRSGRKRAGDAARGLSPAAAHRV